MNNELKIEYLDISLLKPYEQNARKHQEKDLATIKASISNFGMSDPIGIWSDKNIIVEGHGRYMACKDLGINNVPVIRLDHLSDTQRKAYALAHNKTAEMSEWDLDILDFELNALDFDIDMEQFGFDLSDEIEKERKPVEVKDEYVITIECESEQDMEEKYNQILGLGIECRLSTL